MITFNMMPRIFIGFLSLLGLATIATAANETAQLDTQRRLYTEALAALRANEIGRFQSLYQKLDGYALQSYLQYEHLKDRVATTPPATLRKFLEQAGDTPLAEQLRGRWLRHLAARGEWKTFAREYVDVADDPELTCLYLGHRLRQGQQQAAIMARIDRLWLTGKRLPSACEPVFAAWRRAGHMETNKVWERIGLAMEARNVSLAGDLARYLPAKDQPWVQRWQAMYRDPVRGLDAINYRVETPVARMILRHGVVRLGYRDPEAAMARWQQLKSKHPFFGEDEDYVLRHLGILAAQHHLPIAPKWLAAVSAREDDHNLHVWRIKAALRAGEWETAAQFIAALPESEAQTPRWRYWRARAQERTGEPSVAAETYALLARERDYYGFLAADRIGADYAMQHQSVAATADELEALQARPGVQAARELHALGFVTEARRQWNWNLRELNNRQLQVAAVVARQWGWYDRAITTVAKSDHLHDLELRFPLLHRELIEAAANEYALDPGWIFGVVRQESGFVADARSQAGALGLMQVMPATGRWLGRKLKLPLGGSQALLNVETNVRLGASYLKEILTRNNGHQVLATAAYNAGPARIGHWLPPQPLEADVWVETIPYTETRGYVKNVLAYTAVYEHRLGVPPTRLSARMPAVVPAR